MTKHLFFSKNSSSELTAANKIFQQIIDIAHQSVAEERYQFIKLLNQRQGAFLNEFTIENDPIKRSQLVRYYLLFTNTVKQCIADPHAANNHVCHYFNSKDYMGLGGPRNQYNYTPADKVVSGISLLGIIGLNISFLLLFVNLPVGLIALAIAVTLLAPSGFYALAETLPHKVKITMEESDLFDAAVVIGTRQKQSITDLASNEDCYGERVNLKSQSII